MAARGGAPRGERASKRWKTWSARDLCGSGLGRSCIFEKRSKTYVKDHGLGEKHIFSSFFFTGPGTSENVFVKNVNYTNVKITTSCYKC